MMHTHNTSSNTDEVYSTFIGCTVKGLLHTKDSGGDTGIVLVFQCNWGLGFCTNGNHWTVNPEEVQGFLRTSREYLECIKKELEHVLSLASEAPPSKNRPQLPST